MEENIDVIIEDDAAFDAALDQQITQMAEQNGAAKPPETVKPTSPDTQVPSEPSTVTPSAEEVPQVKQDEAQTQPEPYEFKAPIKGQFESEESFAMRQQLALLIANKKASNNPQEQDVIQNQIKEIRNDLRNLKPDIINKPSNNNDGTPSNVQPEEGDQTVQTPQDIAKQVLETIQTQQYNESMTKEVNSFLNKYPEFKDQEVRDTFIEFFDDNYKLEGKTPEQCKMVLELARQAMFRPEETVQERVLKAAGVQNQVNAMQFPGGTVVKQALPKEQQDSIDEMVKAGISEERAKELIS
jgi:hypothetical protein